MQSLSENPLPLREGRVRVRNFSFTVADFAYPNPLPEGEGHTSRISPQNQK